MKKTDVLKGVDLDVSSGQIYGFLGPNGAGKTTTLKCILGFLKHTSGSIKVFGENLNEKPDLYKKIGYSPENAYFYDHLDGIEFLIFAGQLSGLTKQEAELRGLDLLDKLGLLFAKNKMVKSYSKGMRQRLGLAASLINDPQIVFWDEPMSGLDPLGRILVKNLMLELNEKGKTIFFNTHILSDVEEVAHRFGIVFDGKIVYEENIKNINNSLEEIFKETVESQEKLIDVI
ncbi:ABC transporter ATP-binding protein [Candidatus Absconditicoccus praedator]|uniref:ABC transporter ATP-binding protein n=1 Tax=Candidatus Absconditicoccus praedator TaxID=2735562 RepID=UPI001E4E0D87|nr:ABC transporter ATP-binding protein [Candidatus Absconditicoccus praedator]UFX83092.1 ABC transporter ATP-binding protein [Candidatus Absconditicoccus praedator]